jgi:hypothetical protein
MASLAARTISSQRTRTRVFVAIRASARVFGRLLLRHTFKNKKHLPAPRTFERSPWNSAGDLWKKGEWRKTILMWQSDASKWGHHFIVCVLLGQRTRGESTRNRTQGLKNQVFAGRRESDEKRKTNNTCTKNPTESQLPTGRSFSFFERLAQLTFVWKT